jgi:hypothetical protein
VLSGEHVLAYPPHPLTGAREPNPRQALAHQCPAQVLFYGGSRGGGKTEFLATEAGSYAIQFPGIQMLLVRRTREEMKLQILPVLERVFAGLAIWREHKHQFVFFNGSVLSVEFLERVAQLGRFLGAEFGWIGVDQAEQLPEWAVMGLLSCLRSTKPWPKTMRLTGNPGLGVGVGWLRRWFIKPTAAELGGRRAPRPGEIWRPLPRAGDPTPPDQVPTRCFIPARFQDNSALVAAQPNYLGQVYAAFTPEIARAQAEGDWDASDATIVGSVWADSKTVDATLAARYEGLLSEGQLVDWHVVQRDDWRPPVGSYIYGSVDYGYAAPWSVHLHAVLPGGHVRTWWERYQTRVRDVDQAQAIATALDTLRYADGTTPIRQGLQWIVMDPSMWASRKEAGVSKSIAEVYGGALRGVSLLPGAAGRPARLSRPHRWLDALATAPDGWPWWSVTTACPDLIRTLPEVTWDPDDPEVEDDDAENHCYEDTGRFFEARPFAPRVAPPDPFEDLDPISAAHQRRLAEQQRPGHAGLGLGGFAQT